MLYYSTNKRSPVADFREATVNGQPDDNGLYFPEHIPELPASFFNQLNSYSNVAIAFEIIRPYVGHTIPDDVLEEIVSETISFNFPLVQIDENIYALELFHGPTLAFKDVGARFMSRCLGYFVRDNKKEVTVLVATSGDTGGAVANGFYDVEGVRVVILYPSGKVSSVQELQLTTLSKNIHAIEIEGTFDDCQQMVKKAFADEELRSKLFLTSANSINVARWLPQQFYYCFAYKQWNEKMAPVVSVPSGNFGNVCAGFMVATSGLPVQHLIAACNANDVVPKYLRSGKYEPKKAFATISNAMDVGDPSNFVRLLELFQHEFKKLKGALSSYSVSDDITKETIKEVCTNKHYLLDPHGAVGYFALKEYLKNHREQKGYFLATAHPVKFYDVIEPLIKQKIVLPASISNLLNKKNESFKMEVNYGELRDYLMMGNN